MRRAILLVALALLGCGREPSFDERYEQAEQAIREKAAAIDAELAAREKERQADEAGETADKAAGQSAPEE